MKKIKLVIIDNPRLDFKDSKVQVLNFIKKRAETHVDDIILIDSNEVEKTAKNNAAHYIVFCDIMNPIIDFELVNNMIDLLGKTNKKIAKSDGAVPGTQPEFILAPNANYKGDEPLIIRWHTQEIYNNQFNLYKFKRLKIFLTLLKIDPDFSRFSIKEFLLWLQKEDIFLKIFSFGEDLETHHYNNCPHCQKDLVPLKMTMSQPFCGYLPVSRPIYHECVNCSLIVASPYINGEDTSEIYDEFDKQDFVVSQNNPYTSDATRCKYIKDLNLPNNSRTLDLGGGIGNFSKYLKSAYTAFDVTHSDFEIKQNLELEKLGIKTKAIDFLNQKIDGQYDLITAWEVLEHIPFEKLKYALENIHNSLKPGGIFAFSTPDFDSPLCQMNDFFAMCPPFHYTVFGKKWLTEYFAKKPEWNLVSTKACSDFLDDSDMWCDYASKTAPSFQLKSTALVLKSLLKDQTNRKMLLEQGIGTEIIIGLRRL